MKNETFPISFGFLNRPGDDLLTWLMDSFFKDSDQIFLLRPSVNTHTDLPGHGQALWVGNGRELFVSQPFNGVLVIPQVQLGAHQDDRCVWAVVTNLWIPLQRMMKMLNVNGKQRCSQK